MVLRIADYPLFLLSFAQRNTRLITNIAQLSAKVKFFLQEILQ